jgi:tetratricopeptide (TPR) repeat protein
MSASIPRRSFSCLLLWTACFIAQTANAVGTDRSTERSSAPLWRDIARPEQRRARDLLEQALSAIREGNRQLPGEWRTLCSRTLTPGLASDSLSAVRGRTRALRELRRQAIRKRAHIDNAIVRLERAQTLAKDEPEILYALGRALMLWEEPGPPFTCTSTRRDEEAAAVLQRLRSLRPDFAPDAVAFDLAVVLTRGSHFAQAAQAYGDAIALSLDGTETAVLRANLAEVTMLAGDPERAIEHYEHALKLTSGGKDYLLALWGLCVALDRLGEHDAALANADKALTAGGGHMQVLRSEGVFFEPPHELDYYEALAHEALSTRPDANHLQELAAATASFRAFITEAGDTGAFTATARAGLEHVEGELRRGQPETARRLRK